MKKRRTKGGGGYNEDNAKTGERKGKNSGNLTRTPMSPSKVTCLRCQQKGHKAFQCSNDPVEPSDKRFKKA